MQSTVTASGVSFEFPNGRELFHELNFSLGTGITALVGPNGAGKTTLARLIAGELDPASGSLRRHTPVLYFRQREVPPGVTVEEYLSERYTWSVLGERLLEDLARDALCTTLSGGQWMRVRLACVLDSGFLILDEPTNDLDRDGRAALLEFLRAHREGILLISHDRECLSLAGDVLELSNVGLSKYGSGWDAYVAARDHEREGLVDALEDAKRDRDAAARARVEKVERQDKRNRKGAEAAARGGMPKILLGGRKRRAQVSTGKIDAATFAEAADAVRAAHEALSAVKVDPVMYAGLLGSPIPAQKLVAEAHGFNVRFRDWVFARDLEFVWRGNVRVALKGGNGSGKTTLLRAILGASMETRGELRSGGLRTLYIDQRCASLDDSLSVFENVRLHAPGDESEIRNGLAKFLFFKDSVFQRVSELSGGERLRAALACGLLATEKPELLVLDEPTNNLDLVNISFLEKLAAEFKGALLVISHDEVFLRNCQLVIELNC